MINRGRYSLFADDAAPALGPRRRAGRAVDGDRHARPADSRLAEALRLAARSGAPSAASDLQKLRGSGVKVFHPAVDPNDPRPYEAALDWLAGWNRLLPAAPGLLRAHRGRPRLPAGADGGEDRHPGRLPELRPLPHGGRRGALPRPRASGSPSSPTTPATASAAAASRPRTPGSPPTAPRSSRR